MPGARKGPTRIEPWPERSSNGRPPRRWRPSSPLPVVFKRVSLSGSAELFRETASAPEVLAETDPDPVQAPIHHLPIRREIERETIAYYEYQLTEPQARALSDGAKKTKYRHPQRNTETSTWKG